MPKLHWAEDSMSDAGKTACNQLVGWVMAEDGDHVTSEAKAVFLAEPDACAACQDALEEA